MRQEGKLKGRRRPVKMQTTKGGKKSYRLGVRDAVGGVASVGCRNIAFAQGRVVLGSHQREEGERGGRQRKQKEKMNLSQRRELFQSFLLCSLVEM